MNSRKCSFVLFALVIFVCSLRKCDFSGMGKCPNLGIMGDFDISRFTGQWYEIERTFYLVELMSSCITVYLKKHDFGQLEVTVKTIDYIGKMNIKRTISEGIAEQSAKDPTTFVYKISSGLPNTFSKALPGAGTYKILKTDYDNYAIIWKCNNFLVMHTDHIWIYGRQKEINATLRSEIYQFLKSKKLDSERLLIPRNNNCTERK